MYSRYALPKSLKKYIKSINLFKEKQIDNVKYSIKLLKSDTTGTNLHLFSSVAVKKLTDTENKNNVRNKVGADSYKDQTNLLADLATKLKLGNKNIKNAFANNKYLFGAAGVGAVNTESESLRNILQDTIPEPPTVPASDILPDAIPEPPIPTQEILEAIVSTGEPPLSTLGLGGWGPVGMVQQCLEYLHITLDIPWWGAIAIGTVFVRVIMFPLVVIAQRNGARMNNYLPQLQVLQLKMTEARQTGNQLDAARYGQEMVQFMKEKQLNPLKNMIVPLAQMPLFISFFMGLREMANVPVDSMRYGGLFWFSDLTLPDQYFALPIITSLTMYATIELGTDSAKLSSQNLQTMKYVLRALPVIILPFTVNFPGAILCYWVCTNFISLGQVGFLRIPAVRDFFKIERLISHDTETLPIKPKGFVKGMKESWTNMKITNELEGRRRYDEMQFQRAGKGPIIKTYKYDPTKQQAAQKKIDS